MPVTKSAKKAAAVSVRRHEENLLHKDLFKKAVKAVKKAIEAAPTEVSGLFSVSQSALDKAAKHNTIHPNKAARLKSRLSKKAALAAAPVEPVKKKMVRKAAASKKKVTK